MKGQAMTYTPVQEFVEILQPAYRCSSFDGACKGTATWKPNFGYVPRGFVGALGSIDEVKPVFPILGVFRLNGQPKRDDGMIFGSCKARQSPVYPIRDAFLAVNHASCPSLSSSGPRQWGESALKTSRLPGALSLLAKSWLYPPSAWRRR